MDIIYISIFSLYTSDKTVHTCTGTVTGGGSSIELPAADLTVQVGGERRAQRPENTDSGLLGGESDGGTSMEYRKGLWRNYQITEYYTTNLDDDSGLRPPLHSQEELPYVAITVPAQGVNLLTDAFTLLKYLWEKRWRQKPKELTYFCGVHYYGTLPSPSIKPQYVHGLIA